MKTEPNPAQSLSAEASCALLAELPWYAEPAALFALNTGLRVGELLALTAGDVLEHSSIHFRPGAELRIAGELLVRAEITKTKTARHVPINRTAAGAAKRAIGFLENAIALECRRLHPRRKELCDRHPLLTLPLWIGRDGQPLSVRSFEAIVARAALRARLTGRVSPHVLRHTFASRLVELRVPIAVVQSLLGHRSLSSTSRYLHPSRLAKEEAVTSLAAGFAK